MKPLSFKLEQMRHLLEIREGLASSATDSSDRLSSLVWPESGALPDPAAAARLAQDLHHYADQAEQRLAELRQQVEEVDEFVYRLRREAERGAGRVHMGTTPHTSESSNADGM